MLIDLHCHSKYSLDNHLEPEELIERAIMMGLDGVCFTEHYSFESSWPIDRLKIPQGFLALRGAEVSTDRGHLLIYGVEDDSWNTRGRNILLKLDEVIRNVHSRGGICVPAHPYRGWESLGEHVLHAEGIDGIETHNGVNSVQQNAPAIKAASKLGLPSIGGSDCHCVDQVAKACTEFTRTVTNIQDMVSEIKAGACRGRLFYPR
jgi:predicted metal-dependent phosphoesterase TrpH